MPATSKALYIDQVSIERFLCRPGATWYWTFTFQENLRDKDVSEDRLKPLLDVIRRRGGDQVHVWELQKRGAWHLHMLVNIYLDVNWLRPFMVGRGWGPIMKGLQVQKGGNGHDTECPSKLLRYLVKYLTKGSQEQKKCQRGAWFDSLDPDRATVAGQTFKKKLFGGSRSAMVGNTLFKWVRWEKAGSYLYAVGRSLFWELYGRRPSIRDIHHVIRLGYEDSGWFDVDPWYFECLGRPVIEPGGHG